MIEDDPHLDKAFDLLIKAFSINEVSAYLGISRQALSLYIRQQKLPLKHNRKIKKMFIDYADELNKLKMKIL